MNEISQIEKLFIISDEEAKEIMEIKTSSYQEFKWEFILFLKLLYDRLKRAEQEQLATATYRLGECILSFGTDEFIYEYDDFAKFLSEINRARGIKFNPDKYKNKLVQFRGMFNKFFQCLNEPVGSFEALEIFGDLVKNCLTRLGFDQVNTQLFSGHIIFKIDICSRLVKLMEQFYVEQKEYKNQHPNFQSVYVNSIDTYINYLSPRLENWNIDSNQENRNNPYTIIRK